MKQAHIEKVKKAEKIVTALWTTCVVLAIIGLILCTLFMIPNVEPLKVLIAICAVDIISVIAAITAGLLTVQQITSSSSIAMIKMNDFNI